MDDKKDAHYAKHPLFVKFENAKEYVEMNEAFDDKETYAKWFKKNEKFISELNVQHARQ